MARPTALFALCLLLLTGSAAHAMDTATFAAKVKPSIVQLEVLGPSGEVLSTGTGFFISEDGILATNEHVIEGASAVRAKLPDGSTRAVPGFLARLPERDIALVKAEGGGYTPLPLGTDVKVQEGMKVVTLGNPLGLTFSVSDGIVSALRPNGVPEEYQTSEATRRAMVQVTAYSALGSSGSPVLTEEGKVIAVVTGVMGGAGNIVFGVPVDVVAGLKAGLAPGAAPQPFKQFPLKGLLASLAFFGTIALVWAWSKRHEWRRAALHRKAKAATASIREFRS